MIGHSRSRDKGSKVKPYYVSQIFIILAVLCRSMQRVAGPSLRLSTYAGELRIHVAVVTNCWRHVRFDRPGIPTPDLCIDSTVLVSELTNQLYIIVYIIAYIIVRTLASLTLLFSSSSSMVVSFLCILFSSSSSMVVSFLCIFSVA